MSRGVLLILAGAVLLTSNAWVLVSAWRNRTAATGGTVELTERELELPVRLGDSTALGLRLRWDAASSEPEEDRFPEWLDLAKLRDLGFDCEVPIQDPKAREHYSSQSGRLVFVVLELASEARSKPGRRSGWGTRLIAVEAGRDPQGLRAKYPNATRHVITRGLVRVVYEDRDRREGRPLPAPRVRGWLETLVPGGVFVPRPYGPMLQGLRPKDHAREGAEEGAGRFVATVAWGTRYEPWIKTVRRVEPTPSGGP